MDKPTPHLVEKGSLGSASIAAAGAPVTTSVRTGPVLQESTVRPVRARVSRLSSAWTVVAILLGYAVLSRILIAVTVPPWQGPDEPKHFEYSRLLIDKLDTLVAERRLLTREDATPELQTQILASMANNHFWKFVPRLTSNALPTTFEEAFPSTSSQLHRPSLYYILGALAIIPVQGSTLENQLLAIRLVTAVLAGLAVLPAYALLRLIAPHDAFVPLSGAALVAALPMSVYIGGTMNNDNLLSPMGMLATLGMTAGLTRGFNARTWGLILGGVTLGLLAKRGAAILLPGVLACAAVSLVRLRGWRRLWIVLSLAAAAGLVFAGVSSGLLWQILPADRVKAAVIAYALNGNTTFQVDRLFELSYDSPETRHIVEVQVAALFPSFWGVFGWFSLWMSAQTYIALLVLSIVCALGFLLWGVGLSQRGRGSYGRCFVLFGVLAMLIAVAVFAGIAERLPYFSVNEVPQGRYLFVVLGAIAALFAAGLRAWLPRQWVGTVLPTVVVIGGLVALDIYTFMGVIQPGFATMPGG